MDEWLKRLKEESLRFKHSQRYDNDEQLDIKIMKLIVNNNSWKGHT